MRTVVLPSTDEISLDFIESISARDGNETYTIRMASGKEYKIRNIDLDRDVIVRNWRTPLLSHDEMRALIKCVQEGHKYVLPTTTINNVDPKTLKVKK